MVQIHPMSKTISNERAFNLPAFQLTNTVVLKRVRLRLLKRV